MNMKSIEKIAKTVDEAITEALIELGASTDEVDIEILCKGSKGLLGIGAKQAKVKVTLKEVINEDISLEVDEFKVNSVPVKKEKIQVAKRTEEVKDSEDAVIVTEEELNRVIGRAKDFLGKLLKEMNIESTINVEVVNNNRISICLEGKNMGTIIGKRGETLDAIQYLVNIVANKERQEYIKIMLDTENYRARREETLRNLAYKLSKKAQKTRKPIILEPMNPYDRRIIHSALQDSKIVKTHSEGKEPFRKVVITPNYQNRSYR